jgi:hypothetical protein
LNQEAQTVDAAGRVHVLNRENGTGVEQWYVFSSLLSLSLKTNELTCYPLHRFHYHRSPSGKRWTRTALPLPSSLPLLPGVPEIGKNVTGTPTVIGKRGKLFAVAGASSLVSSSQQNASDANPGLVENDSVTLYVILPSNAPASSALAVLASTSAHGFRDWVVVWAVGAGCGAEPVFDRYRLAEDGILSVLMVNGTEVQVWDFDI